MTAEIRVPLSGLPGVRATIISEPLDGCDAILEQPVTLVIEVDCEIAEASGGGFALTDLTPRRWWVETAPD